MKFISKSILTSLVLALSFACNLDQSTQAKEIDPNTGEGTVQLNRKLHCSLKDGEEVTYRWFGNAYARIPGQKDTHMFKLEGMNVRQCTKIEDKERGVGYRMVSREIMLYLDPKTGEIIRQWENPWTKENIEIIHVANDPVNGRPNYPIGRDGKESTMNMEVMNGTYFLNYEVPLFYSNPLGGDYQKQIGGTYHSAEIFDFSGNTDTFLDANIDIEYGNIAWVRIAKWLPWMNMGDRPGIMYFNAVGKKLKSWDDLPDIMKAEIKANYPDYTNAPSLDDKRPNETSWTYMKKVLDKRAAAKKETEK